MTHSDINSAAIQAILSGSETKDDTLCTLTEAHAQHCLDFGWVSEEEFLAAAWEGAQAGAVELVSLDLLTDRASRMRVIAGESEFHAVRIRP